MFDMLSLAAPMTEAWAPVSILFVLSLSLALPLDRSVSQETSSSTRTRSPHRASKGDFRVHLCWTFSRLAILINEA